MSEKKERPNCELGDHLYGSAQVCMFCQAPKPKENSLERLTEEQRQLIDQLAESISRLCHQVIARRLEQFAVEIAKILEQQKP